MQKQVSSRKSARESITRNQALVVRKNLKPQENVNIINCAQKSLTCIRQGFLNNIKDCDENNHSQYIFINGVTYESYNETSEEITQTDLFNRIFYVVFRIIGPAGLALYHGMETGSLLQIYFYRHHSDQYHCSCSGFVNKKINPSYKLGWTMLILVFPVFGLLLYILFGKSRIAQKIQEHYAEVQKESLPYMEQDSEIYHQITEEDPSAAVQSNYIRQYSGFPAHGNTTAEYFQVGDDMFPVLVEELEQCTTLYLY